MTNSMDDFLRFPIGRFNFTLPVTQTNLNDWISRLEILPDRLEDLVRPLTEEQLDTAYRPGGWTVRQVVHHIADSHHNSYIRFKWSLTEEWPLIKVYKQDKWAMLKDYEAPVALSLNYLSVLHTKLVLLIKGLSAEQLERGFVHPETNTRIPLRILVGQYAWHGDHHYAHIAGLVKREKWQ